MNDLWEFNPSTQLWTWVGGSSTIPNHQDGTDNVFGPLGVFDAKSIPGSRWEASGWTDGHGNLWLFGGEGYTDSALNDLWEFNPSTRLWAWMGGSNAPACRGTPCGQAGVYGTMGTPAAGNFPGGRYGAANWIDNSGDLWIVGGEGLDSTGKIGLLNDVWRFNPTTVQWTWMGGDNSSSVISSTNIPSPRSSATTWTDPDGNFWIFGGTISVYQTLSDLWKFTPLTNQWTLMTPATKLPPVRGDASGWTDQSGNLWLFGGYNMGSPDAVGYTNELWEYKLSATFSPAAVPVFSVASGTYNSAQTVAITDTMPGATFYYTTDGKTTPTTSSTKYTGPITVLSNETIQAIAVVPGFSSSPVASAAYTINLPPGFTLALSSTSLSVQSGQQGTVNVTLTPYSGFSSAVTFACSGMPYYASCAFNPNSVTPNGIPANTTLTISVKSQSAALRDNRDNRFAGAIMAFAVCLFGWKRKRNLQYALLLTAVVIGMGMLTACGGSSAGSSGSTPTTYAVSVTAVSGSIQQSIPLSLTLN
ncbi:MAG: kelch repeat-containing protein [Acidobacteriaceae bacterium]|nr:kelch repeat-containing protein [Acidobacteriaceae bacterium]